MYHNCFFFAFKNLGDCNLWFALHRTTILIVNITVQTMFTPRKFIISDHGCKEHVKSIKVILILSVYGHFTGICCTKFQRVYYIMALFESTGEYDQTPASPWHKRHHCEGKSDVSMPQCRCKLKPPHSSALKLSGRWNIGFFLFTFLFKPVETDSSASGQLERVRVYRISHLSISKTQMIGGYTASILPSNCKNFNILPKRLLFILFMPTETSAA